MKALLLLLPLSGSALAVNPSFSEVRLGFETISYSETLNDVAGFGKLSQSIDVTNPAIRQISYTGIDDDWGFYIESAATISTEIETETFGKIQDNKILLNVHVSGFSVQERD
mgnify:CR=1 FL=1